MRLRIKNRTKTAHNLNTLNYHHYEYITYKSDVHLVFAQKEKKSAQRVSDTKSSDSLEILYTQTYIRLIYRSYTIREII